MVQNEILDQKNLSKKIFPDNFGQKYSAQKEFGRTKFCFKNFGKIMFVNRNFAEQKILSNKLGLNWAKLSLNGDWASLYLYPAEMFFNFQPGNMVKFCASIG